MTKQLISNYTFSVAGKTITLTDFTTIRLDRIRLITDVTTNKILYNFADSTIATATVATNVITLSALQGGEANTDKLQIDYDGLTGDPTYDTPVLPNGAATAANQATGNTSLAAIKTDVDKIPAQGAAAKAASMPVTIATDQPAVPVSAATLPLPTGAAQDGTDISTPTAMPAGGAGIRGWLSAIWTKLNGSLAVTGTFFQATQPTSIADGSNTTFGAKADAKNTATDTTAISAMQVLKQISASVQAPPSQAVTNVGTFAVQAAEADGANVTLGSKTDAKSTATDITSVSIMQVLKQISASVQAPPSQAVTNVGTFATQATLSAETTKIIGVVKLSDGTNTLTPTTESNTFADSKVGITVLARTAGSGASAVAKPFLVDASGNLLSDVSNLPATVDTNSGVKSASTLRVVLATDQPALTTAMPVSLASLPALAAGTNAIGGITGAGSNGQIKDDTFYGDGVSSGVLAEALRIYNGTNYDRLRAGVALGSILAQAVQADTFGTTTALTITLASLANSAAGVGRQSTLITSNTARSAMIGVKIKMGTTPTANSLVYVYLIRGDGTLNDDGAGASDAGLTVVNAGLLGTLLCSAATTGLVLTGLFDTKILGSLGKSWGIAIVNNSGVALDATGANHVVEYTLMT